jgi:hypothetical protein
VTWQAQRFGTVLLGFTVKVTLGKQFLNRKERKDVKKVINGKVYNTETATQIGTDSYNGSTSDFQWWDETLYKTKKGQFFLSGEGGPMSRWSRSCGNNSTSGGSDIVLLSDAEALEWAEAHMDADEIAEHFTVEEG